METVDFGLHGGLPELHHDGWDDERMARRMNKRDHWNVPGGQKRAL